MDRDGGIGITDEHRVLRDAVRRWTSRYCPPAAARAVLDMEQEELPAFWDDLVAQGWLGLHIPEAHGGEGFGLTELAVVVEELGRVCAPGPFLPTTIVAAALGRHGHAELTGELSDVVAGRTIAGVAVGCEPVEASRDATGWIVDGSWEAVLGAARADVLLLPVVPAGAASTWVLLRAADLEVEPRPSLDRTRRVASVRADRMVFPEDRLLQVDPDSLGVEELAAVLLAAEGAGLAAWCVECAAEYAKVRLQFGRPIGQFQAVKHRCADMLCALEQARAAAWDACLEGDGAALAAAVAAAVVPEAAYQCAKDCIQVLGGIGFTWEHDAHVYLKRATANRLLLGGPRRWRARAGELALGGERRQLTVELPPEADEHRQQIRDFVADLKSLDRSQWRPRLVESGYVMPHWPAPWGRDASPVEQVVIDEELARARVRRPHLDVGAWVLPTLIVHGSPEQQKRWISPTMRGEVTWCQMFSEPNAGSDLAALSTKATRVEGGWLLTGQKVWTSMAHAADWGLCLARTAPAAPRHEGIGCFVVDMRSPGIEVRPLRELTGTEMFNEVFLSDVFVPDACVVGEPTSGWSVGRTTLANERVTIGQGSSMGPGMEALLALAAARRSDPALLDALGALVAATQSLTAMGRRMTLRALGGASPGAEASIRKLLGVELDQSVQEVGLELLGPTAVTGDGDAAGWIGGFLGNRCLSIAGGTSEIQRNVIAERLLGLPRDP